MQIPYKTRYFLSIYVESVLKIFKQFNSLRVVSLGVGFWCFNFLSFANVSIFVAKHQHFLAKIVPLLKAMV